MRNSTKQKGIIRMKKIIILDVEGMSTCKPYNIGYIIADKKGNIYKKRNFAILSCIFENLKNCLTAKEMTHKNIQEILQDTERQNPKYQIRTVKQVKEILLKDIENNNISEVWAYNCSFDKAALKRLFEADFSKLKVKFYDIIPAILYSKLLTKKYINFCQKNGYITEKGNIQTKAEIVYRYLTGKNDFAEEHTGLADVLIEYEILLFAINSKKKVKYKNCQAWQILKKFCQEKNLDTLKEAI